MRRGRVDHGAQTADRRVLADGEFAGDEDWSGGLPSPSCTLPEHKTNLSGTAARTAAATADRRRSGAAEYANGDASDDGDGTKGFL